MKGLRILCLVLASWLLFVLPSCGGGGGATGSGGTGTLSLYLTDATTLEYKAVYVTIDRVDVHLGENDNSPNNWKTVAAPNPKRTYNLLELVNGVWEHLGRGALEAGHYTQMRLIIGTIKDDGLNILGKSHPFANYVILADEGGTHQELKVPSGPQTGIKIVHGFTIHKDETTRLLLDFDANRSVVKPGTSGNWLLKPMIKAADLKDCATFSGRVSKGEDGVGGVLVSAQTYDPDPLVDPKDQVVVWSSTVTDENGEYTLFLRPGTYNVVAYKQGCYPTVKCSVNLASGETAEGYSFTLEEAPNGTQFRTVSVASEAPDQHATISFRQFVDCDEDGNDDTGFEVISVNVAAGGTCTEALPPGDYEIVASSYGKQTLVCSDTHSSYLLVAGKTSIEIGLD